MLIMLINIMLYEKKIFLISENTISLILCFSYAFIQPNHGQLFLRKMLEHFHIFVKHGTLGVRYCFLLSRSMLQMGSSKPWRQAMYEITGQREVKTDSIKRYFKPLIDWLELENKGEQLGWDSATINWTS